jgi:hypothetical protein
VPSDLFSTPYQLEKFIKHTDPSSCPGKKSVFTDPSTVAYWDHIDLAVSSGYVEVDSFNRTNICWVGSGTNGTTYRDGLFYQPTNSVKVVLHDNALKIHAFPYAALGIHANSCANCGMPIL